MFSTEKASFLAAAAFSEAVVAVVVVAVVAALGDVLPV